MFVLTSVTVPLVIAKPPEVEVGPFEITPLIVIGVVPTSVSTRKFVTSTTLDKAMSLMNVPPLTCDVIVRLAPVSEIPPRNAKLLPAVMPEVVRLPLNVNASTNVSCVPNKLLNVALVIEMFVPAPSNVSVVPNAPENVKMRAKSERQRIGCT